MALLNDSTIEIDAIISVTDTCIIQITDDKLENILYEYVGRLKKSKEWMAALSFSITILLVLLTSDFKDKWGINKDGWQMLFIIIFIVSVIYMINTIINCFKHNISVKTIIIDIKGRSKK